jgi:hypothetical protein
MAALISIRKARAEQGFIAQQGKRNRAHSTCRVDNLITGSMSRLPPSTHFDWDGD